MHNSLQTLSKSTKNPSPSPVPKIAQRVAMGTGEREIKCMKITTKDLREWSQKDLSIRYHGEMYRLEHNGRQWQLRERLNSQNIIGIYHKSRGVYGLETNK